MHLIYSPAVAMLATLSPAMEDCPLCAHEVDQLRYPDDPMIVEEIQARFPEWAPEHGLCNACLKEFENPFRP